MTHIEFSWDNTKAGANINKHGISFEEARSVFFDPNALIISDPEHSEREERFIILGVSIVHHILVVCHCYRKNDSLIRIISARKATRHEQQQYRRKS